MIRGKTVKFGNNIDTDQIIAARHLNLPTMSRMAKYTFEHHPVFHECYSPGDFIVGEENFGCGSSREQAPAVLKELGVGAIVAKSFARIFYRNAINIGIILVECKMADQIDLRDVLEFDGEQLVNLTKNETYKVKPYPPFIQDIFEHGGIVPKLTSK